MEKYYSTREVCWILGVTNRTLRRWIKEGRIKAVNVYGRWRIPESEVKRLLGQPVEEFKEAKLLRAVAYARVSGSSQKKELENQVEALKKYVEQKSWRLLTVVSDIASGLNEDRRGLRKVLDMAKKHEFDVLVVAYRDRLTRFGFTYLQELFKAYGVDVVVAFQEEPKDYMRELVEDMVEIVTSFAARIYGKRSHRYEKLVKCVEESTRES
uniref:IS607 family transposase n=1 Tax=Staphylothermus marinus TaxID=2280 RepID=A0A7J3KH44_STAMA